MKTTCSPMPWSTSRATNGGNSSTTSLRRWFPHARRAGKPPSRLLLHPENPECALFHGKKDSSPGGEGSLQSGKVSCTGQSILLVCALRSVGIPARMAGVLTWNHVRGNHNWVEAWCDGEWKMLEYNEKDFNTPWVMSAISMLDPRKPENAIYATSWKKEAPESSSR